MSERTKYQQYCDRATCSPSFAQRDVLIPIEPNQMVTAELVGIRLKLNYYGLSRAIVYLKEQYAVGNMEVKTWQS